LEDRTLLTGAAVFTPASLVAGPTFPFFGYTLAASSIYVAQPLTVQGLEVQLRLGAAPGNTLSNPDFFELVAPDGVTFDFLSGFVNTGVYQGTATSTAFNNLPAQGWWTLYVFDPSYPTGSYMVANWSLEITPTTGTITATGSNHTKDTADHIPPDNNLAGTGVVQGTIASLGQTDFYTFTVAQAGAFSATVTPNGGTFDGKL